MNAIYITLKPLATKLGISHRSLEKIIVKEFRKGNKAPRYQLPHVRSYLYIFDEFFPWFKKTLKSVDEIKIIKKLKPIDLFKQQKQTDFINNVFKPVLKPGRYLTGHKADQKIIKNYVR